MTVSSELSSAAWVAGLPAELRGDLDSLEKAYFRHVDAADVDCVITGISQVFRKHLELAMTRPSGRALVRVYSPEEGLGAAVQLVSDDMPLLVESITSSLSRMGASVSEVIHPIFGVARDADGTLTDAKPYGAAGNGGFALRESWMHVQLHPSTTTEVLERIEAALPDVVADVRQVVDDTVAIKDTQNQLADDLDRAAAAGVGTFPAVELSDCAELVRWLAEGNFTILGYARYRQGTGPEPKSEVIPESCLGVLRRSRCSARLRRRL